MVNLNLKKISDILILKNLIEVSKKLAFTMIYQ